MVMKSDIRKIKKKTTEGPPMSRRSRGRRPAGARKPEARRIPSSVLFLFFFGPLDFIVRLLLWQ